MRAWLCFCSYKKRKIRWFRNSYCVIKNLVAFSLQHWGSQAAVFILLTSCTVNTFMVREGLPRWHSALRKEPACHCGRYWGHKFNPWVGKIPWSRKWQPAAVFLEIPWTEEPGGLQSMQSQRVTHDWVHTHTHTHVLELRHHDFICSLPSSQAWAYLLPESLGVLSALYQIFTYFYVELFSWD